MKVKKIVIALALGLFTASSYSAELNTPNGYTKIKNGNGVDLYKDSSGDVYVQVVDLKGGGDISFDGFANVAISSQGTYYREKISNLYSNNSYGNLFSAINGQFFDNNSSTTGVAFPVKANYEVKSTAVWDNLSKRTFMIGSDQYAYITKMA